MKSPRPLLLPALFLPVLLTACGAEEKPTDPVQAPEEASGGALANATSPVTNSAAPEEDHSPDEGNVVAAAPVHERAASEPSAPKDEVERSIDATPAPAAPVIAMAQPAAFKQCVICHTASKDEKDRIGPNLFGVVGRKAGTKAGYTYSPGLVSSGLVWTPDTLDRFLEAPRQVVPGTKMAFAGQKDPEKRKQIVEFLSSLK